MCGISGIYNLGTDKVIERELAEKMRDSMAHRGPDGSGLFLDNRIALGHRRLSIIDLSENGKQPFESADGRYVLVFNGEIYNYREFYSELQAKGYTFRSGSDSEVLLNLFIEYGPSCLLRLNGMWAFAIWDRQAKELFLCRDRMGVKPLYHT